MLEYITKAQAIDLVESMRNLMAKGVADAFIKGIEGLEGCRLIKHREPVDGKTIAIKLSPEIVNTLRGWISVKDKLPPATMPPHDVLAYHDLNCGMFVDRAWYSHEKKKWRSNIGMNLKVTHWMPLPEPPKE